MGFLKLMTSIKKAFGLSSNKLLKCVLLNAAVDLFSYVNAPSYFEPPSQCYYWDLERFDHLYSTMYAVPQSTKVTDASTTTDGLTDQDSGLDMQERSEGQADTELPKVCVEKVSNEEANPPLVYISAPDEDIQTQVAVEQWYYMMPICLATCIDAEAESDLFLIYTALETHNAPDVFSTPDWMEGDISALSYEDGRGASILWDSYDLHASRSRMSNPCAEDLRAFLSDFCSSEDLMFMDPRPSEMKEMMRSSTPSMEKVKPRTLCL